jgi:4-diphosphocytidyl-2-C-methyl-D-erythritol kinase
MTRTLRLIAPGKINWSLEILRFRPDGYHEIRSVLQTIDLHDVVTVTATSGGEITVDISGEAGMLAGNPIQQNLAYRAATALRKRAGIRQGAHIVLEKHVPVASGLGGGSSDAAAVLRALNDLWGARQPQDNLIEIAGEIGSDPPFFVVGGTAVASGRGDVVEALPDADAPSIMLAIPPAGERGEKTALMFDALTPDHFAEGYVTIGVQETVRAGRMIHDDLLNNTFEHVTSKMQPDTECAMDALRAEGYVPHLCGAGPSFFLLYGGGADLADVLARRVRETGFEARPTYALRRDQSLRVEEL